MTDRKVFASTLEAIEFYRNQALTFGDTPGMEEVVLASSETACMLASLVADLRNAEDTLATCNSTLEERQQRWKGDVNNLHTLQNGYDDLFKRAEAAESQLQQVREELEKPLGSYLGRYYFAADIDAWIARMKEIVK